MDEKNYVILRTYKNVWKFERQIYSLEGIKLLFPVKPNEVLYFTVSLGITILLVKIIPFMNNIPWVFKFVLLPYGIMKFLTKQKLDGKLPHKFFLDAIVYKLSTKRFERHRPISEARKHIKFVTPTSYQTTVLVDKTEEALRSISKTNKSTKTTKKQEVKNKKKSRKKFLRKGV